MTTDTTAPVERQRDPVCGMSVRVDAARSEGLVMDHDGHAYFFCRAACRDEFVAEPGRFVPNHSHDAPPPSGTPEIDDGMRRWYESCACCLSDAYPEVKAALDAERAAADPPPAGICEVAEATEAPSSRP